MTHRERGAGRWSCRRNHVSSYQRLNAGGINRNVRMSLCHLHASRNEQGIWTGDHVPGTYCNKNVYDCDRR